MEYDQKQLELVECYLDDQLTEQEKKDFELRLEEDKNFQEFYRETRLLIDGIMSSARKDLLAKMKITEASLQRSGKVRVLSAPKFRTVLSVAAGLALLISISVLFGKWKTTKNMEEYLALAMEPYSNIIYPTQRSNENELSSEELAYYYYDAQEYATAIQIFSTLELTGQQKNNITFYKANAFMGDENYDEAIKLFTKLLNEETIFENQTKWYLSLCLIKVGQPEEAQAQLTELILTQNSYKRKAEELLKKMK